MEVYMHDRVYIDKEDNILGYGVSLCKMLKSGRLVPLTQHQCAVDFDTLNQLKCECNIIDKDEIDKVCCSVIDNTIYVKSSGVDENQKLLYQLSSNIDDSCFIYSNINDLYYLKSSGIRISNSFEDFLEIMRE